MSVRVAVTVGLPREDVERRWASRSDALREATVTFKDAPGDRGTEIHAELPEPRGGKVGELVQKVAGTEPRAKLKDELRRFKQLAETGEVPRSEGMPSGEQVQGKLKPRPAQPLSDDELHKAGAR